MDDPQRTDAQAWLDDPLSWVHTFWPHIRLYDKQEEILLSVRDNPETFVYSGNEMGKTFVAALAAMYFFLTHDPARVIVTSSTEAQLEAALWMEIEKLKRTAKYPLGLMAKYLYFSPVNSLNTTDSEYFMRGRVASSVEAYQGVHASREDDQPHVMFCVDEASGMNDSAWDAITTQAHRALIIGNPLNTANFYYRCCKGGDIEDPDRPGHLIRKVIQIGGDDSPNVRLAKMWHEAGRWGEPPKSLRTPGVLSWAQYRHRERTWDEQKKKMRLYGHFNEGSEDRMFPFEWLKAAEEAWAAVQELRAMGLGGPRYMGIDVAGGGRSETVWYVIDRLGIVFVKVKDTPDTSVIVDDTRKLMAEYNITAKNVAFDYGYGGKMYADLMRRAGQRVRAVNFGEGARDKKTYQNRRVEMYGRLRDAFNPLKQSKVETEDGGERWDRCMAIPGDGDAGYNFELREELAMLPLMYDAGGKMVMLPKSRPSGGRGTMRTIDEMLGRSPDRADALALANWAMVAPQKPMAVKIDRPLVYVAAKPDPKDKTKPPGRTLADRLFGPDTSARQAALQDDW